MFPFLFYGKFMKVYYSETIQDMCTYNFSLECLLLPSSPHLCDELPLTATAQLGPLWGFLQSELPLDPSLPSQLAAGLFHVRSKPIYMWPQAHIFIYSFIYYLLSPILQCGKYSSLLIKQIILKTLLVFFKTLFKTLLVYF